MAAAPLLQMRGIVRCFGTLRANDGIDFDVLPGQIVGLLGENGSGKTTLMKILFGMQPPDSGRILFRGRDLSGHGPAEAMRAGLAMIHQHFMLVEAMTVVENVMLGWAAAGRVLRRAKMAARIGEASRRFGLDLDPEARISDLSPGRRQRVEILKAILRDAELLILDEPTSNLAPSEIAGLLGILRRLRAERKGIVFITHKLPEVMQVCDTVVVLRAGRVTGRLPILAASPARLAEMMVGRSVTAAHAPEPRGAGAVRLDVEGLRGQGLAGIDLQVRAGEIVGVAGVDGNGQLELSETLAGLRRATAGRIALDGKDITRASVAARTRAGLAYLPADRAQTGLVGRMSVAENFMLRDSGRPPYARRIGVLAPAARDARAKTLMVAYDIRAPGPSATVARLSGGNQQKILVARELERAPSVVVAHQATWGLDPGATSFVLDSLIARRNAGTAVLYISSELEEVFAIGDRIAVLADGRFAGIFARGQADLPTVGLLMAGRAV